MTRSSCASPQAARSTMRTKVMLLAVGLGIGGTETHVLELASGIDRSKFDVTVCSRRAADAWWRNFAGGAYGWSA